MLKGNHDKIVLPKMVLHPFPVAGASSHLTRDQKRDARILYLETTRDSMKAAIFSQAIEIESLLPAPTNGSPIDPSAIPIAQPDDLFLDSLERRFDLSRHKKPVFKPSRTNQLSLSNPVADSMTSVLPLALETKQKSREYDTLAAKTLEKYYASKRRDAEIAAGLHKSCKENGTASVIWGGYERDRDPRLAGRTWTG